MTPQMEPADQVEKQFDNLYLRWAHVRYQGVAKLAKTYACVHCRACFTQAYQGTELFTFIHKTVQKDGGRVVSHLLELQDKDGCGY